MEAVHKRSLMEDGTALICQVLLEGKKSTPLGYVQSTITASLSHHGQKALLLAGTAIVKIMVLMPVNFVPPKSPYSQMAGWGIVNFQHCIYESLKVRSISLN